MDHELEFFTNDRYKILNLLSMNLLRINEDMFVPLSQQEISDLAGFSKLKTNKIINELIDHGYVGVFQNKRGKYEVTEKGMSALEILRNSELKG